MRTKRVIALSAVALGLAAVVAAAPAAAAPEQAPGDVGPANSAKCTNGRVEVEPGVTNLPVRQWPSPSAPILQTFNAGEQIRCIPDRWAVGERYNACDGQGANGYVIADAGSTRSVGFVYMTCVNDF